MKLKLLLGLFFNSLFLFSQNKHLNNSIKYRLSEGDNAIHTVLVKASVSKLILSQKEYNYKFNYASGDIASISCNLSGLSQLIEKKIISYAEFIEPRKSLMNDTMLVKNKIKPVKLGAAPLPMAYDGTGIVVGIIDSGTDFSHPDFKDALGNSRIKFLWDQVPTAGSTIPQPYNYGIEWTDTQINANQCTHSDLPHYGHGTHVSGIAAGNGLATGTHEGIASKADIVVVALDFNKVGPTIADAVQYIFSKATLLGKPCVINASVGDYYGSHDGTDFEAKLIQNMVQNVPGRVLVAAAGNAGNIKHHVKTQPPLNDTSFTWIKNNNATLNYWCYADTNNIKNIQISVGANRNNNFNLGRIGFKSYNYGLTSIQSDTLKFNGNRIGIVKTSASINVDGVYELYLKIIADTVGLKWRIESKGVGLHDSWNFDFISSGLPSSASYPWITKYVLPDFNSTIVSSFQCLNDVITVANYVNLNMYYDVNNTLQSWVAQYPGEVTNNLAPSSSWGPTRDNKQKPDIAATGAGVFSAMALGMQTNLITNAPQVVAQGSVHVQGGGTSAASPVVAGLAALYLQKNPTATSIQVKNAITNCAFSDSYTGTLLPNYKWGYGKLDGLAAMTCIITNLNQNNIGNNNISYYPNPFLDNVTFEFDKNLEGKILIYSVDGKLLFEDVVNGNSYQLQSSKLNEKNCGLLFVRIISPTENITFKLIRSN
ncbi:MAG: S8 family peptidase [Bacteroidota bacterium]|nr:S8 family peptidase [Bacteroidota bacterium]MDP3145145.1 S8 family peptidase [Bacteroidota bacterium]